MLRAAARIAPSPAPCSTATAARRQRRRAVRAACASDAAACDVFTLVYRTDWEVCSLHWMDARGALPRSMFALARLSPHGAGEWRDAPLEPMGLRGWQSVSVQVRARRSAARSSYQQIRARGAVVRQALTRSARARARARRRARCTSCCTTATARGITREGARAKTTRHTSRGRTDCRAVSCCCCHPTCRASWCARRLPLPAAGGAAAPASLTPPTPPPTTYASP